MICLERVNFYLTDCEQRDFFAAHKPWAEKLSRIPVFLLLGEAVCRLIAGRWLLLHLENNAVQYLLRRGSRESRLA